MASDPFATSPPPQDRPREDDDYPLTEHRESDEELSSADNEAAYFASITQGPRNPITAAIRNLGIQLNARRRKVTIGAHIRGAATAWLDMDDSGNYDPKQERAKPRRKPPKKRRSSFVIDEDDSEDDDHGTPRKIRKPVGYSFPIILTLSSKKGLAYLRSITPGLESSQSSLTGDEILDSDDDSSTESLNRRRKVKKPKQLGQAITRADGLTLDQLTEDHPQRKGCKACFKAGDDECSLIEDSQGYPCTACDDADNDCELIIPPAFKKACERCKEKRISCSYRKDGARGVDPCEACEEADVKCYAAPLPEKEIPEVAPERVYVSCNQCRNGDYGTNHCNMKRDQTGPCRECKKVGQTCTFVYLPVRVPTTKLKSPPPPRSKSKSKCRKGGRSTTPDNSNPSKFGNAYTPTTHTNTIYGELEKGTTRKVHRLTQGKRLQSAFASSSFSSSASPELTRITNGIRHTHITTFFCHPLTFNYIPDPSGNHSCNWCNPPFFGLWGLGERTVEVIPWGGKLGNEELSGGHAEEGNENSKMCVGCTFERMRIMSCSVHDMHEVKDWDPLAREVKAIERSFRALEKREMTGGELAWGLKWCSVCVSVAEYRCCSGTFSGTDADEDGCGLLLCETCNDLLGKIERSKGNMQILVLDELIKLRKRDLWKGASVEGVEQLRADVSFLMGDGELMGRLRVAGGEAVRGEEVVVKGGRGEEKGKVREVIELSNSE